MLRRIALVLIGLVAVAVVAVAWLGLAQIPVLSSTFGMDRARDLAMPSDRQAFEQFCAKYDITRPSDPANYTLSSQHHWSGSVAVDDTLSEAALGSLREFTTANSHLRDIQFRIHAGFAEVAAFVTVPGYPLSGPIYGKFSVTRTGPRTVSIDISQLDFGRVGVPGDVQNQVKTTLATYLNKTILEAGITIDTLSLQEGGIRFKGTWPKVITADAPNPQAVP